MPSATFISRLQTARIANSRIANGSHSQLLSFTIQNNLLLKVIPVLLEKQETA